VKAQGIGNGGTGNGHPFSKHFTVVPIPMHPAKQRQRGFNQAELLARYFCDRTRFSLEVNGLQRVRQTEAQFNLSVQQRQQNLDNAFSLGQKFLKRPPSAPVLLLDDIYTTGATALSAAQTLQQHGIQVQGIIVLAKTAPKERRKEKPILKQQKSKEKHDGFF
jgi:ComF family protein